MAEMTKCILLSVQLEKDYAHTLYFANSTEQYNYFYSKRKKVYTDFSYQRKDNIVRVPEHIDTLQAAGVNYLMYQNPSYPNKWFYAFITDMEYSNPEKTTLKIETDVLQTWAFNINVLPSFVEREHAATDEIGENTIDEGLELGEYICNLHEKANYGGSLDGNGKDAYIVLGVTKTPAGENAEGMFINGIYSGVRYYAFDDDDDVNAFLGEYDEDGVGEAVQCMFMAPAKMVVKQPSGYIAGSNQIDKKFINYSGKDDMTEFNTLLSLTQNTLNGYSPKNNKLMCFPFRYLLASNNSGGAVPYKYELFYKHSGNTKIMLPPEFIIEGCLTPGCSVRMVPANYNGAERNDDEGINLGKYPILNWTSDVYTNWLTQNGVNIALQIASGVGQIVAGAAIAMGSGGLATAVGGGSVVGGVNQIAGTLAQIHQQSFAPPQTKGNLNCGDVVTASDQNDFHFYEMTIKKEYAQIIDEYFNMFGYKCHRVKIPATAHRANYWYTKTIDANITGSIPQDDLQKIKDCYNRGVTFWRNSTNFRNYAADNAIV